MNTTEYAMAFFLVVVIVVVVSLLRQFGPGLARAAENAAGALLNAEQRSTLYAAVKVGLRAAAMHDISFDQLIDKAIEIAANYLKGNGLDVDADLLRDLILAEQQKLKQAQPKAATDELGRPVINLEVKGPSPITPEVAAIARASNHVLSRLE